MNYIMEDGFDFNKILMEAVCSNDKESEKNTCLISQNLLNNSYITLQCNHKFNYSEIFHEICKQKKKPNLLEIQKLSKYELKCPYCRYVQKGILPYNSEFKKVKYVNWPPTQAYSNKTCQYKVKSGKNKGKLCNIKCMKDYCWKHNTTRQSKPICKGIIKSGKRKGQQCIYIAQNSTETGDFCKIHAPKKDNK